MSTQVRPFERSDRVAVSTLLAEADFKPRSSDGWDWVSTGNPHDQPDAARGWVIEQDGDIAGYLGNLVRRGTWRGQALTVGVSADWYVREAARDQSTKLLRAFFKQPGIDVAVSTTANAASGPVYGMFKAKSPAQASFRSARLWVVDDTPLVRLALHKAGIPAGIVPAVAGRIAGRVRRRLGLLHPRTRRFAGEVTVHTASELPADLDGYFRAVEADGRWHPTRSSAVLRWLMSDPDGGTDPVLLVARNPAGIQGTLLTIGHCAAEHPFAQRRVVDLTAVPGPYALGATGALLSAAVDHGRPLGAAVLYAPACGPRVSALLSSHGGHAVAREAPAHYARAKRRKALAQMLDAWEPTGLSGDSPLCLQHAPADDPPPAPRG